MQSLVIPVVNECFHPSEISVPPIQEIYQLCSRVMTSSRTPKNIRGVRSGPRGRKTTKSHANLKKSEKKKTTHTHTHTCIQIITTHCTDFNLPNKQRSVKSSLLGRLSQVAILSSEDVSPSRDCLLQTVRDKLR